MLSITAVVPTCERPDFLRRALQSIVAQECAPSDIVVVDDGGHEAATRAAVQEWGFGSVHVAANSHAKGPSGARNTGAEIARGEFLAFLDDDDEWLPSYLFEALSHFEKNDLDVLCADSLCRFEDEVDRPAKTAPDKLLTELFLTRNPGLGGSNLIIRKSNYHAIGGFDESFQAVEDMDFGLRLSLRGDVRYERLPKRLVRFHQHRGPKLGTAAGNAMRQGIRRFYQLHAYRMSAAQREEFRNNVHRFWSVDEHGNTLKLVTKTYADSLLATLKAWLDQQRVGFRN